MSFAAASRGSCKRIVSCGAENLANDLSCLWTWSAHGRESSDVRRSLAGWGVLPRGDGFGPAAISDGATLDGFESRAGREVSRHRQSDLISRKPTYFRSKGNIGTRIHRPAR